jgi:hypothetical protein
VLPFVKPPTTGEEFSNPFSCAEVYICGGW